MIGFLQSPLPLHLQYFQHLISATLQKHPFWRACTFSTSARIRQTFRFGENNFRDEQTATSHKSVRHGICSQGGISKWCLDPQLLLIISYLDMFPYIGRSTRSFLKVHLEGLAVKCSKTKVIKINVSRSVDGLKHLTKNVFAISISLSVSCGRSKLQIREEFPGLRVFRTAASLVDTLLVVSHPVGAGRHLVSSYPSAMQIS